MEVNNQQLIEENKKMREDLSDIHYALTRLDPLLEMPTRGYVRNGYNRILNICKDYAVEDGV